MRRIASLLVFLLLLSGAVIAQNNPSMVAISPRHRVKIFMADKKISGLLQLTTDSSVLVFNGGFRDWRKTNYNPPIVISYTEIKKIKFKRKTGRRIARGLGIGAGIGAIPAHGVVLGPSVGQGAAYVVMATVPLGSITGIIVGAASGKSISIRNDYDNFQKFRKKVRI